MSNNSSGNWTADKPGAQADEEHFPGPDAASRGLSISIQALNLLALALNAGLLVILARKQSRTGAKGLILLAAAEIGINLSLLMMHAEVWTIHSHSQTVLENFNYSFEAFHLLRNAWLSAMTIARALAVSRPFSSSRLLTKRQQAIIFGVEALACAAWSLADLLLQRVAPEHRDGAPGHLRRALALLRHVLNTVVVGTIIVVTSSITVHQVRRSSSIQQPVQQHQQHRRRDRQASKIVVTLAVGFFLLEVPNALVVFIVITWAMIMGDFTFIRSIAQVLHIIYRVNHLLIVLNTCLNPFVLLAFSSGFRRQVRDAIVCRSMPAGGVQGGGGGGGTGSGVVATPRVRKAAAAAAVAAVVKVRNGNLSDEDDTEDNEAIRARPLISPTNDQL